MKKDKFKEENKEFGVPEYYSFNSDLYNSNKESFRYEKEDNDRVFEDNLNGSEDNLKGDPYKPDSNKFKKIEKITNTSTIAVKATVVAASSVAIIVGGVMIFNEMVLPPSHVEIIEAYAYENNIGFMVYASNYDEEDMDHEHEQEFGEECDLEIELYGNGEHLTFHMNELGYFYEEFTGLKYDSEYELSVYQNITIGFERPLLASTKIRTEPENVVEIDRPRVSELEFEKYSSTDSDEVVVSFMFSVEDPDNYYSDLKFNLNEKESGTIIDEIYLEKGDEDNAYYGSAILSTSLGESYNYSLTALSSYPLDLIDNSPSTYEIYSGTFNLSELSETNQDITGEPRFYSISFYKSEYPDGSYEYKYYLSFDDPMSYWVSFQVQIEFESEYFDSYANDSHHDDQIFDAGDVEFTGELPLRVYVYSINPADLEGEEHEKQVLVYEEIYDFTNIYVESGSKPSEFYFASFSKESSSLATGQYNNLGVTLYYSDACLYWSNFTIKVYKDSALVYEGELSAETDVLQTLTDFDITDANGEYNIVIECETTDPEHTGETNKIVLYNENVDFDSL